MRLGKKTWILIVRELAMQRLMYRIDIYFMVPWNPSLSPSLPGSSARLRGRPGERDEKKRGDWRKISLVQILIALSKAKRRGEGGGCQKFLSSPVPLFHWGSFTYGFPSLPSTTPLSNFLISGAVSGVDDTGGVVEVGAEAAAGGAEAGARVGVELGYAEAEEAWGAAGIVSRP